MERYVIHVTKECNCNCKYCYEKDKTSKYKWEDIKELIDNIIKNNKEKEFNIEFLGGEPLLAFELIKKSYLYLESFLNIKINNYCITTNGTILNDEIINFLKNNPKVIWAASLDGTKWMNQFRTFKDTNINTYDKVIENYKILKEKINNNQINIHMVTHPYNIAYLYNGIKHLYNLGIRSIGIGTVESTIIIENDYCKRYIQELDEISKSICNGTFKELSIDVLDNLKPKTDTRFYIKDSKGKIIAESYGRSKDDITSTNIYNSIPTVSQIGTKIYDIRNIVYNIHQERLKNPDLVCEFKQKNS